MISILHPSRQRPEKSLETCKKWIERAGTDDIQLILSIDKDDPDRDTYFDNNHVALWDLMGLAEDEDSLKMRTIACNNKSAVDAINKAADEAIGNILIVVSDDTDCPENWAVDLQKSVEGKTDWIAKCPDGIQGWIITMPIMDRWYYNRFGYIYYPEYSHMFCDTELTCVADLLKRRIDLGINFPHQHYSTGASVKDAVSEKADATWTQGEDLFLSRLKKNFDLAEVDIIGKITDESYRAWIATKLK